MLAQIEDVTCAVWLIKCRLDVLQSEMSSVIAKEGRIGPDASTERALVSALSRCQSWRVALLSAAMQLDCNFDLLGSLVACGRNKDMRSNQSKNTVSTMVMKGTLANLSYLSKQM